MTTKRSFATIAALAALLAAAAPAHAGTSVGNPGKESAVIESIGTKYTMLLPRDRHANKNELTIETLELSGDAYDNEMGFFVPEVGDEVL